MTASVIQPGTLEPPAGGLPELRLPERHLFETRAARLVSAETAILSFRSKKLPQEVALYRSAARETDAILREALGDGFLCPGRTTQAQLRDHVQQIAAHFVARLRAPVQLQT